MNYQRYSIPEFAHKHPSKDGEWLHDKGRKIEKHIEAQAKEIARLTQLFREFFSMYQDELMK